MNIDEMEAGSELDALMAQLMGHPFRKPTHGTCCTCQICGHNYDDCQCGYGDDIGMAWEVVEKLIESPHSYEFYLVHQTDGWDAAFQHPGDKGGNAHASSAPLAICRAALKAVQS